jgi:large subunit ribosomal protein L23
MSIFGKNKTEEKNKDEKKTSPVKAGKKVETKKSMKDLYGSGASSVAETKSVSAKAAADKQEIKKNSNAMSSAYRVLLRPLVTEKGSHMGVENKYLFEVDYNTNKIEVAKAIESAYGIKPVKVNMMKFEGKVIRRGRTEGRRKRWKKAIVTLPAGKSIQIYEGI